MLELIISTLILIGGSAFCSSSEAALFSLSETKIESLVEKNRQAKKLLNIKKNLSSSIGALVITNNIFNILGTLYVGILASRVFESSSQIAFFSISITIAVILFGEILPKNFGERFNLSYSFFTLPLISLLTWFFKPILYILEIFVKLLFPKKKTDLITEEEIMILVERGKKTNVIENDEHLLIQNVFKMNDKTARDIMTPRINISALNGNSTLIQELDTIENFSHSRIIVYQDDLDNIIGYVLIRETLEALARNKGDRKVKEFVSEILKVKQSTRVDSLLIMFQKKREHIALVVDEFGGTAGIVTLEDVLEELVGEIVDEFDEVVDMREVKN